MAKGTVNKVILLGRLGANPEVRTTQTGMKVANLSLATNDGMGDKITTEWHRVVVFGKSAEIIEKYTSKGSQLYIEGRLQTRKWQDRNGNTQYSTDIIANSFQFINGGNMSNNQQNSSGFYQNNHQQANNNFNNQSNFNQPTSQPTNNFNQQSTQNVMNDNLPSYDDFSSDDNFDDDIPF